MTERPKFLAVDHVSRTVPDLAAAISFYVEVFGATELFRMGPLDSAEIPLDGQGKDWTATHLGVPGAKLSLAMLRLMPNLNLQLIEYAKPLDRSTTAPRNCDAGGHHVAFKVEDVPAAVAWLTAHGCTAMETIAITEGPLAGKKNVYVADPWGLFFEIVD